MLRLWLLAFAGTSRSEDADHAHESGLVMAGPLIVLALFSVGLAWGWPVWDAEASALGHLLHKAAPKLLHPAEHHGPLSHLAVAGLALAVTLAGFAVAFTRHARGSLVNVASGGPLVRKWYFDELYAAVFVRPTVGLATATAAADRRPPEVPRDRLDGATVDGILAAAGLAAVGVGGKLRHMQAGRPRGYVLALGLTVAGLLGILVARL